MKALPADVAAYRQTPIFDEQTLPQALRAAHATKAGVWARIVVVEGELRYQLEDTGETLRLVPGVVGIAAPEEAHAVAPMGRVRFYVEFLRAP
jgi:tellurite resistance-related uncharacterized protein